MVHCKVSMNGQLQRVGSHIRSERLNHRAAAGITDWHFDCDRQRVLFNSRPSPDESSDFLPAPSENTVENHQNQRPVSKGGTVVANGSPCVNVLYADPVMGRNSATDATAGKQVPVGDPNDLQIPVALWHIPTALPTSRAYVVRQNHNPRKAIRAINRLDQG